MTAHRRRVRALVATSVFLATLSVAGVALRALAPDAAAVTGGIVAAPALAAVTTLGCFARAKLRPPGVTPNAFAPRLALALGAGLAISLVAHVAVSVAWETSFASASAALLFAPLVFALALRGTMAVALAVAADEVAWRGTLQPLLERAVPGGARAVRFAAAAVTGVVWGVVQAGVGGVPGFGGVGLPAVSREWWPVIGECVALSLLIAQLARGALWQRVAIGTVLRLGAAVGMGAAGAVPVAERVGAVGAVTVAAVVVAAVRSRPFAQRHPIR